jgi:hypothetical protein
LRGKRERGKRRKLPICHKLAENRQTKKERLRWLLLLVGCGGWLRGEFQRSRQTEGKKQKRSRSFIYAVVRIFVREKKLRLTRHVTRSPLRRIRDALVTSEQEKISR